MKNKLIACLILILMFLSVTSVFAQEVPKAPAAIEKTLKGMNIVIGLWWRYYDTSQYPPSNQWVGSDYQEKQLEYRKKLLQKYKFTMTEKEIASWERMGQITATSIMAGKPAASIFVLQPDWALALYRQNLLYPVSSSKAVNGTQPLRLNGIKPLPRLLRLRTGAATTLTLLPKVTAAASTPPVCSLTSDCSERRGWIQICLMIFKKPEHGHGINFLKYVKNLQGIQTTTVLQIYTRCLMIFLRRFWTL